MIKTEIHQLSLGVCNCYLIKEEELILVDAGSLNQGEKFLKELNDLSIEPKDISLILLTHGHWDHSKQAVVWWSSPDTGLLTLPRFTEAASCGSTKLEPLDSWRNF